MSFLMPTCNRLLKSYNNCFKLFYPCRCQHSIETTSEERALPSNLVLFGISKEKYKAPEPIKSMSPPASDVVCVHHCTNKIPIHKSVIRVWVDNLKNVEPVYNEAAELHPLIFDVHPRMDILHEVVKWQKTYREVDYAWARTRAELGRGKAKPWPQKGTGLKRQGSRAAPFWKNGGICHGPRGPRSLYYQLSDHVLVHGLTIALTVKLVQNDLVIVRDNEIPEPSQEYLHKFMENRGLEDNSILFIHAEKKYPENLGQILATSRMLTLMPSFALNVYSMLKHDKLILPVDVLNNLENKLIWSMKRFHWLGESHNFYNDLPGRDDLKEEQILYHKELASSLQSSQNEGEID